MQVLYILMKRENWSTAGSTVIESYTDRDTAMRKRDELNRADVRRQKAWCRRHGRTCHPWDRYQVTKETRYQDGRIQWEPA